MEPAVRTRQVMPLVAALGVLAAGILSYTVDRGALGLIGGVGADFAHAFAFGVFTVLSLGTTRRAAWVGATAWGLVASALELGQHAALAPRLATALPPWLGGGQFARGTFDPADLAALAAGCVAAALTVSAGRPRATPAAARKGTFAAVLVLGAATTLGCYGPAPSGEVTCTADPPPAILSSPPTTATVGVAYEYYVNARWACFFGVCNSIDGVTLPPGAEIDDFYDRVSWTPPPEAVDTNVRFVIETEPDWCGDRARQSWTVRVYPAPVITSFSADPPALSTGETTQLLAIFDGTGIIVGIGPVTSGVPVTSPPLSITTTFTLIVSNSVGGQVFASRVVPVGPPPVVHYLEASPDLLTTGDSATLRWSVSGAYSAAVIEPPGIDVTNLSQLVVAPPTTTMYTLTLYRGAEAKASANVPVTVVPPPVIDEFTVEPTSVLLHQNVALTTRFHDGTAELRAHRGYGSVPLTSPSDGATVADLNLMRTTTYALVVRNIAGTEVSRELTVPVTGPGTFQAGAHLPLRPLRARHTATLLPDGRVFIAGGAWADTELFDPANDSFVAGPPLPEPLDRMGAAPLPDGRVLLVGGLRANGWRSLEAQVYDPQTNTIDPLGPLPVSDLVAPEAAALPDGRVLVVHGSLGYGAELFDPSGDTFSTVAGLQSGHGCLRTVAVSDGRVAVIDGSPARASEIFTPGPDAFATTGAVGIARCYFAAAALPGLRVLVTGGASGEPPAEVLDLASGTFTAVGHQAFAPGSGATATSLPGAALVVGGAAEIGGLVGVASPIAELFDPATGSFTQTGGPWRGRGEHSATRLADGRVLVVGGCGALPCEAELYTPP